MIKNKNKIKMAVKLIKLNKLLYQDKIINMYIFLYLTCLNMFYFINWEHGKF